MSFLFNVENHCDNIKRLNFLLERCLYADSLGQIMMAALNSIHVSFTCFFYTFTYTIFNQ